MARLARRTFLQGAAGLVVAFNLSPRDVLASPVNLNTDQVDSYLVIDRDGNVTIYVGKVDLGTGARAAFRQIVAEELYIRPQDIDLIEGDTALTPNQGGTGGSSGISSGGMQLRQAAATARQRLLNLAAPRLGMGVVYLETINGAVLPKEGGVGITYGTLIGGGRFNLMADKTIKGRNPDEYTIVGKPFPRPDLPAKLTATHEYVQDVRVDGMLHARVIRPPKIGAGLTSVDETSIAAIAGARIVRIKDFLAVVAPREWDAVRAMDAIKASWGEAPAMASSDKLYDTVRQTPVSKTETVKSTGDTAAAFAGAARVMSATYRWPIQSHASMGPSCAVADIKNGGGTVWSASQGTHGLRQNLADILKLDLPKLRVIYRDGSGSYGTNGNNDVAFEATLLSRELGKPVRVQWTRQDELGWDPKGPPQIIDVRAALDAAGDVIGWESVGLAPEGVSSPTGIPLLSAMAAGLVDGKGVSTGALAGNLDPPYAFPNMRADMKWLTATPLRPSNLRAPGKIGNVFSVECFLDEIADATHVDPLAFRLKKLSDPRAIEVLKRVGTMMAWTPRTAPPDRTGVLLRGRGLSYMHYKQAENYVAMGMEVEVERTTGRVRVTRVVCAHDCGQMINPDTVRAQVEGSIIQTLSRTLFEEVKFDQGQVTSVTWASYPIMTFPDVPKLEIDLIDRPHERAVGAGEAACAPVAAALGNAVFDATGVRLRDVPFTPASVKAAFADQRQASLR